MVEALQRTDPPMLVSRNGSEGQGLYVSMDPRHAKASTLCMPCHAMLRKSGACLAAAPACAGWRDCWNVPSNLLVHLACLPASLSIH